MPLKPVSNIRLCYCGLIHYIQIIGVLLNQNMIKKLFLNWRRAIPAAQVPSVSRKEIASTSRNNPVLEQLHFISEETTKSFPKFNATGRSMLIKLNCPGERYGPATSFKECFTALKDYVGNYVGVDTWLV